MKKQYKGPIVLLGCGHGASNIGHYLPSPTLALSVFDNGGHSRELRRQGHPALGDLRRGLLALASDRVINGVLGKIFSLRLPDTSTLSADTRSIGDLILVALDKEYGNGKALLRELKKILAHDRFMQGIFKKVFLMPQPHSIPPMPNNWSVGNFILAALNKEFGYGEGLLKALNVLGTLLEVKGRVLPISLDRAHLRSIAGSKEIATEGGLDFRDMNASPIMCSMLIPVPRLCPAVDVALRQAKLIVIAPGTLWPVIANIMVDGSRDAIHAAIRDGAKVAMITNLMIGENELAWSDQTSNHLAQLVCAHLAITRIHAVLVNSGNIPAPILEAKRIKGIHPIRYEKTGYAKYNVRGDFVSLKDGEVRHNKNTVKALLQL